jgi:hypothetical protein
MSSIIPVLLEGTVLSALQDGKTCDVLDAASVNRRPMRPNVKLIRAQSSDTIDDSFEVATACITAAFSENGYDADIHLVLVIAPTLSLVHRFAEHVASALGVKVETVTAADPDGVSCLVRRDDVRVLVGSTIIGEGYSCDFVRSVVVLQPYSLVHLVQASQRAARGVDQYGSCYVVLGRQLEFHARVGSRVGDRENAVRRVLIDNQLAGLNASADAALYLRPFVGANGVSSFGETEGCLLEWTQRVFECVDYRDLAELAEVKKGCSDCSNCCPVLQVVALVERPALIPQSAQQSTSASPAKRKLHFEAEAPKEFSASTKSGLCPTHPICSTSHPAIVTLTPI